uniref:NADH-ubiquinone oxidoreductase chain 2 n=1 Tax=Uranoscopus japonicus TaxID=70848 RepID=A0A1V1FZ36_URAJA|nr:NADH dehydrogenase subunit 2 [Uranoscopus japonicus]BAX03813.1 NADH dehydrogenase subunit 2 [Uranoscopus japonicus]BBU26112.1 NADH dehydrogenase subunit 2 [Uranoscopus japonicus]
MNPFILISLLLTLGLGTMITFMSSHWLLAWMGLEINTLAIIPIMARYHHPRATEAATKYFLAQASAAATLLFAATTNAWLTGQWDIQQIMSPIPNALMIIALAMKIGLAPIHAWLPEVLQGLDLATGLLLSTWQKLAPLALLFQIHPLNPTLTITLGLTSSLVGGWGGLNQTQLRKILAYSSIAHLGWMTLILHFSPPLFILTLLVYLIISSSTFLVFKLNNSTNINMLAISWAKMPALSALAPPLLLSLGGLPPLTGFMPKLLIIQELTKQNQALTATVIALSSLLSLFFYLRLTYVMTLTISPNNLAGTTPWRLQPHKMKLPLATLISFSLLLLPLTSTSMALLCT